MKKIVLGLLAVSLMLCGCQMVKSEKSKMEESVTSMLQNVVDGNYENLDQSFINMPSRLSDFIGFFSKDSDNSVVTQFQELIQKETKKMTYKITESTCDKEKGEGTVTVEITYVDLSTGLKDFTKTALSSILDAFTSWMNKEESKDIMSQLQESFNQMDENYATSTVTFNMKKVDDKWMIDTTDNTFIDVVSGNSYTEIVNILDKFLNE